MPVSAAELEEMSGVISMPIECFGVQQHPSVNGVDIDYWFFQDTPTTFAVTDNTNWSFSWSPTTALRSCYSIYTYPNKKIEFIINVSDGEEPYVDFDLGTFAVDFIFQTYSPFASHYFPFTGYYEVGVDGVVVKKSDIVNSMFINGVYTGTVKRYVSITYYTTSLASKLIDSSFDTNQQYMRFQATRFSVNNQPTQLDRIEINIDNIETSIENIEEGVVNIQGTVTDMKEQLEDPDSSIWDAAGEKISSTLEDLFVPTPEDIGTVKDGFDQLSKDKLGGAYTAMETVEDTVRDVTKKLHNPNPNVAIEFPGISVPLGGDIGIVTLAEEQPVTLPTELTAILHPVAGTIFSIICGLGTFNVLKDMVECFLSGYSYAAYLHRNKGGSDG